ncbi:hypothetical protein DAPPUDRAFT_117560 [Daphnia pulex]|uniref:Uncharacterized protein n=1 Tax=Daphnia pulex TaxID=6669 RepID=E9HT35_DAPPU|nr:hypothetical protein DAPPUDRAFT_117560 [Daphnia pulex]|eukprot:EFX65099.1 hypothetical protein DAPPUDRAFT_117560 [Daphnia pulex]
MAYKAHKLLEGYEEANSDNLPEVKIIALANFIAIKDSNFISPEISNIKAMRSGRESYGKRKAQNTEKKIRAWSRENLSLAWSEKEEGVARERNDAKQQLDV